MLFTDPTCRFLTPSTSGNQYILVVYEYDGKFIHAEPMVDRKAPSIIAAYKQAVSLFESRGFKPLFKCLYNEASSALQSLMDDNVIAFQLSRHTATAETPPSVPFTPLKITSSPASVPPTVIFLLTCGTNCFRSAS
jgi:hypothetical protein